MTLSPFEVERREFAKSPLGYRRRDVDHFIDEVHRTLSQLWQERSDAREETEVLRERLTRFEQLEDQLKNTLLLAQDSAEKAHEQARRESDLILREAGQKARDIVHVAHEDKQRLEMVLRDLHSAEQEARARLRALAGAISSHLDDTEQLVSDSTSTLRAVVQAQPESTELRVTSPETVADMVERAAIVGEVAELVVDEQAVEARIAAETASRFDDAELRPTTRDEVADAFFDAPPSFDPTERVERSERVTSTGRGGSSDDFDV